MKNPIKIEFERNFSFEILKNAKSKLSAIQILNIKANALRSGAVTFRFLQGV